MFWFDPYLWRSYKKSVDNYLWNLRPKDSASEIQSVKETSANELVSIVSELFKKFGSSFWYCLFLKTAYELVSTTIYIVFYFLILVFEAKQQIWKGYLCCALFGVILSQQILCLSLYQKNSVRLEIRVKSAVLLTLYSKALRISNGARRDHTISDIVNLLSVDANKLQAVIPEFSYFFSLIFQIIVSFYYLWYILGPSVTVNIFVMTVIMWVSYYASAYMKKLQQIEMKNKDTRGKFMQEIFTGIKVLKMYAWELSFKKVAANLRYAENKTLKKIGCINTIFQVIFVNSPFLLCLCGYAAFTFFNVNNVLDVPTAFLSMAVFNSFRVPFQILPSTFLSMQQFLVSVERIDKFLNAEELDENTISHEPKAESLIMEDATFFWNNAEGRPILENLNLKIKKGSLIAIVGPVGAGKSSLISAFLGEMYKVSGYGTIAYVPQQAWIMNTTVKQNITVDENIDSELYKTAIQACDLQPDLEDLPAGDLTEIGEKGINLSGGQKQRISLARAVCREADIYFFDDPLSAVDSNVSNHIFGRVLGSNGVLKDKTRVLITHSTKYFSYMDQIIVLKSGRISESGTYEELMNRNGELAQLLKSNSDKNDGETEDDERESESIDENITNADTTSKQSKSSSPKNSLRRRKKKSEIKPPSSKLIEKEQIKTKQVSMKLYWTYISAAGVITTATVVLLFTINQTIAILSGVWLSFWISENNSSNDRYVYLLIYTVFGIGQIIATVLANIGLFYCTIRASTTFYDRLLNNVLRWPMSSFDSTPIGRIINRFGDDVYVLDNVIGYKISTSFVLIARYTSIIVLVVCIIPSSIIITLPTFIIYFLIKKFFVDLFHQLKRIESMHRSPLYSHLVESVSGVESIRAYGFQRKFISQFKERCDHCSASYYSTSVCLRWLDCRCATLGAILICFITILCIWELDSSSVAQLALLMTYILQLARGLNFTLFNITQVEDSLISVERINEYIKCPQEPSWEKHSQNIPKNWPTNGEIIFQKYQLRYRKGLDLVLRGLTFKIQSGEKIGIVGRTGAGKSSIILGLFRIVEPADGTIIINNVDITTVGLHKLRSQLTVIPQDPILFSGTLSFNLDPFGKYPDEHLWDILEKSHLKNFVQGLPGGLRYNIEEGGRNLSFGQRQLICLARALLRKSRILVLDEATASVDMKTDELIQKTIRNEFPDSTVITIAHRLNTLQDYDKILILDGGRIVDFDTTENLLKSENSRLREMMLEAKYKS